MKRVGISPDQYNDSNFQMLKALGFTQEQIDEANNYVCGTMTIEGAPHLKLEHYPVFDCANRCGKNGVRCIQYMGHVRMMAAVQPFLSGAISKTINMPNEVTVEDITHACSESWKMGLKAVALYRDGCKLSQPLSTSSKKSEDKIEEVKETPILETSATIEHELQEIGVPVNDSEISRAISEASRILKQHIPDSHAMPTYENDGTVTEHRIYLHGEKRKVPAKRSGITVAAKIGNQQIWLRTGEYPDGRLAEIFIDMYKEGAAFRSILNMFAISVSMGLQYGVPLEKYVNNFVFTRFEPAGVTDHPNIKICTSVLDFVFRVLGMEYLGRTDFVQVKPNGIQKNRFDKIAQLLETSVRQEAMQLKSEVVNPTVEQITDEQAILPSLGTQTYDMADQALSSMDGDAPACPTCGHVTVRNGACYKCLNCGDSLGCS
ncbi:MAG: hypothetical protein Q8O88_02120 [bacterium]|nr:hypothetical protein [bacterium]